MRRRQTGSVTKPKASLEAGTTLRIKTVNMLTEIDVELQVFGLEPGQAHELALALRQGNFTIEVGDRLWTTIEAS